jgi:hypothetical protein
MTYRNVVAKKGDNMAVVDVSRDLCGKMKYRAGVLKIKMVPQIWPMVGPYTILVPCLCECDCGATWYGEPDPKLVGLYWWKLFRMPR